MWGFSDQGLNLVSSLASGLSTSGPPGSPCCDVYITILLITLSGTLLDAHIYLWTEWFQRGQHWWRQNVNELLLEYMVWNASNVRTPMGILRILESVQILFFGCTHCMPCWQTLRHLAAGAEPKEGWRYNKCHFPIFLWPFRNFYWDILSLFSLLDICKPFAPVLNSMLLLTVSVLIIVGDI